MGHHKQPVLFLGHGSPMNAIANNSFTQRLNKLGGELARPRAILVISAHWLTSGTYVTSAEKPRMIYDMQGFPEPLYQVKYPAAGDPELAAQIQQLIPGVQSDQALAQPWGLDHGTWSVLVHLFPKAEIPVLQLSIDHRQPALHHFELGRKLTVLRDQGVLIIGSGNIVHNLRNITWSPNAVPFPWAVEFTTWYEEHLLRNERSVLLDDFRSSEIGRMSVPTTEHYFPSIYILGAAEDSESPKIEYSEIQNGSISMTSFSFGRP